MAGRKDKNTVDYFPHYCSSGKTLFIIESKFGHVGYSIWFKTLEMLGNNENHFIDLRDESDKLYLISKLKITENQFTDIYDLLAKLGAIDVDLWKNKIIYSENFVKNIEDAYKRRLNKCMHKYDLCKHLLINCNDNDNKNIHKSTNKSIVKYSKENNSIIEDWEFQDHEPLFIQMDIDLSLMDKYVKEFKAKIIANKDTLENKKQVNNWWYNWLNKQPKINFKFLTKEEKERRQVPTDKDYIFMNDTYRQLKKDDKGYFVTNAGKIQRL